MARVELVLGLVVLAVWVFSLVGCILAPAHEVRNVPKVAWLVLIVLLPLLGSVLWLAFGRPVAARPPRPRSVSSEMPPASYRSLTSDERIRRLEQDLARLEQEPDRPSSGEPRPGGA